MLGAAAAVAGGGLPGEAPEPRAVWVELPVGGAAAGDLELRENGEPRPVLGLGPWGPPRRVVIVFDRRTADGAALRRAASGLADGAGALTAFGPVELAALGEGAGEGIETLVPASANPAVVGEALLRLALLAPDEADEAEETDLAGEPPEDPLGDPELDATLPATLDDYLAAWLTWAAENAAPEGGLLLLVSEGREPAPEPPGPAGARLGSQVAVASQVLEAYGWTVVPYVERSEGLFARGARPEAAGGEREESGLGVDLLAILRRIRGARREAPTPADEARARDRSLMLRSWALASGCEPVLGPARLVATLDRLARRSRLRYAPAPGRSPGVRTVEVWWRSPAGASPQRLLASGSIAASTPPAVTWARARRAWEGEGALGGLELEARLEPAAGAEGMRIRVRVASEDPQAPLSPGPALEASLVRVGEGLAREAMVAETEAVAPAGEEPAARELLVALPPAAGEGWVVQVEDPATGLWGVQPLQAVEDEGARRAAPRPDAGARSAQRPPSPGAKAPQVRIVAPSPEAPPRSARVEVEAELELAGRALDRVEFYWNSVLAGVRRAAPLRQTIQLGSPSASGWVRVVAWLGDGSSVEDALPLNLPGGGERVDVRLVQLQVVAADGERRPVRGLRREDFRLLEGNRERQISSFGDGSELPLTLALAIDTSASMFRKLPAVERAAGRFLGSVLGPRDRALVVGFGREAKVVAALGSELPALLRGVGTLEASGETGIWRAIAYTLAELESVPGRKAVVVYSDGVDQDADFRFASCLRLARRLGTPIYVILSNGELVRTGGRGLYVRPLLARFRRLTRAVGGHLYLARVDATLEHVYAEIAAELRSQYLLGFYAAAGDEEWRPLRVEVRRPGVEARTLEGYFR